MHPEEWRAENVSDVYLFDIRVSKTKIKNSLNHEYKKCNL